MLAATFALISPVITIMARATVFSIFVSAAMSLLGSPGFVQIWQWPHSTPKAELNARMIATTCGCGMSFGSTCRFFIGAGGAPPARWPPPAGACAAANEPVKTTIPRALTTDLQSSVSPVNRGAL